MKDCLIPEYLMDSDSQLTLKITYRGRVILVLISVASLSVRDSKGSRMACAQHGSRAYP